MSRPSRARMALAAAAALVWLLALFVHGHFPGMTSAGANNVLTEGAMHCARDLGVKALWSPCHAYGEPEGARMLT